MGSRGRFAWIKKLWHGTQMDWTLSKIHRLNYKTNKFYRAFV